jgi:hypothetical protein
VMLERPRELTAAIERFSGGIARDEIPA